jgi:purine-binding chemotaxis protein CheW
MVMGLLVDQVSDILTVSRDKVQPLPDLAALATSGFAEGMIVQPSGMICFLDLNQMFSSEPFELEAA